MCIAAIIHKPISLKYLQSMDTDNPHGGGVAWIEDGRLHFKRGLDAHQVYALQETRLTYPYLLHFRWATHGDRIPQLTHPFPTGRRAFMGELEGTADEVLIHNGVWRDYDDWAKWLPTELYDKYYAETSDTAIAAYFYQLIPDLGDEIPWAVASAQVAQDGTMKIRKHGGWSKHEGNEYSNLMWLPADEWAMPGKSWRYLGARGAWSWEPKDYANPDYDPADHYTTAHGKDFSWDEYVKARYGSEVADAVADASPDSDDDAELMAKLADPNYWAAKDDNDSEFMAKLAEAEAEREWAEELGLLDMPESLDEIGPELPDDDMISDDCSLISEDPMTVNRWLAKKSTVEYLKKGA